MGVGSGEACSEAGKFSREFFSLLTSLLWTRLGLRVSGVLHRFCQWTRKDCVLSVRGWKAEFNPHSDETPISFLFLSKFESESFVVMPYHSVI